jgi:ribosomal protein S20
MPIIKSAIKRMHQAATRKARNQQTKRGLKAAMKAFTAKMTGENLQKAQSEIDKAVKKNLLPKNTAARKKAQLAAAAKAAGVKSAKNASVPKSAAPKTAPKATAPAEKVATKKPVAKKAAAKPAAKPAAKKPAAKKAAK